MLFCDLQETNNIPNIIIFSAERFGYRTSERFTLAFEVIKFKLVLQRNSLKSNFYGFISDYCSQWQVDIQEVIDNKINEKNFLQKCCDNSHLGDYIFIFYLSSFDRKKVKDAPIFACVKKNGFADSKVHEIKETIIMYKIRQFLCIISFF